MHSGLHFYHGRGYFTSHTTVHIQSLKSKQARLEPVTSRSTVRPYIRHHGDSSPTPTPPPWHPLHRCLPQQSKFMHYLHLCSAFVKADIQPRYDFISAENGRNWWFQFFVAVLFSWWQLRVRVSAWAARKMETAQIMPCRPPLNALRTDISGAFENGTLANGTIWD